MKNKKNKAPASSAASPPSSSASPPSSAVFLSSSSASPPASFRPASPDQASPWGPLLPDPSPLGSYPPEDVTFLLKDISGLVAEQDNWARERAMQAGVHYSEMLPLEYRPSADYLRLFHRALQQEAGRVARLSGIVAERILRHRGQKVVLVSLARAGTPIGVLIRRYLLWRHRLQVPHYSISIIRDKGFDENALRYLLQRYEEKQLLFVDGWTGKGMISRELQRHCRQWNEQHKTSLSSELAVLADPASCANLFGSREDFLIPSACLNSTVSGLVSRTFQRPDIIGPHDFHGARFYRELAEEDLSLHFLERVCAALPGEQDAIDEQVATGPLHDPEPDWRGWHAAQKIARHFAMDSLHRIKPGVGETTRVLLRRIPWRVLVRPGAEPQLGHILQLARERQVAVETFDQMSYSCCGLIRTLHPADPPASRPPDPSGPSTCNGAVSAPKK